MTLLVGMREIAGGSGPFRYLEGPGYLMAGGIISKVPEELEVVCRRPLEACGVKWTRGGIVGRPFDRLVYTPFESCLGVPLRYFYQWYDNVKYTGWDFKGYGVGRAGGRFEYRTFRTPEEALRVFAQDCISEWGHLMQELGGLRGLKL